MPLKEKVYNFISEQITLGKLKRNDRVTEQYLAEELGMSRTPIREALLQLTSDDILEREPRKGFKIKQYTKKDVEDLYELIGVLDGKVAEIAVDYMEEADFLLMQFLIDSMNSSIENKLYTKYNEIQSEFHQVYIDKCPNKILKQELMNRKKIFIGKHYSRIDQEDIQGLLKKTNAEHVMILEFFKQKKKQELRNFLEHVHWVTSNAQYDIW